MEEEEQKMIQGDASLPNVRYSFGRRNKRHSDQVRLNVGMWFDVRRNKSWIYLF